MQHTISAIGSIRSPYTQKFGIARQPGLVPAAKIQIVLNREFTADSVRGLQDFEYIWVHFIFHGVLDEGWAQMVRPPRLGGKQKVGVFATRSPHRPNHLGLSLLKLEAVRPHSDGIILECSGADLLDGTPVIDIKPYIPFVEAKPDAACGFVTGAPEQLTVVWQANSRPAGLPDETAALIEQSIAQDPRPAYQNIPERIYVMEIADLEVKFSINQNIAEIIQLNPT
ncbi:MAG: tRNA (N6-threonylcarbamoyladenosine(37)-N6)-methyltransferase TrmO [Neisseria sp.]|nr:tRNA (N6-threonylcarbamoyladenosine(37)-N6)-methyltransferase TrmO [Neisseria sp.]